uniref:DUF4817 domain-containing protein n=1 Tax=Panagrolaimus superbus TaxID=310955 RepID=A0A914Z9V4_9BILA
MDQSITSNSTLSLHITAYENALEAVNVEKNGNKITTKVIKKWEYGKQVPTASTTDIQNPFEFPRQQENQAIRPEVMEYRADQGLLNPNDRGNYKKYTPQQKTDCVIWYIESWSPTSVQRSFHAKYGRNVPVPDARTIKQWFERFQQRGTVYRIERVSNRPVRTNVNVQEVLEYFSAFQHSSLRRAENELGIPKVLSI